MKEVMAMAKIQRAILSCYDKTGIVELARLLQEFEVEIISTSGTLKVLQDAGVEAIRISEFTGVPELLNGRVKSLHHKVHAGLLGIRENKVHQEQMEAHGIPWIDMLVANLHPLEEITSKSGVSPDEIFEQTDIGGAAMIRSAAKNFRYVTVVTSPDHYARVMHEMRAHGGEVDFITRYRLAQDAFECTAAYDRSLAEYFQRTEPPEA